MGLADQRGLTVSSDNPDAVAAYDRAVQQFFVFRTDAIEHVDAAIAADPAFAAAHLLKGYMVYGMFSTAVAGVVEGCLQAAAAAPMNQREKWQYEGLQALSAGNHVTALAVWDQLLATYPHDLFILRQQHIALFWRGRALGMRNAMLRVAEKWDRSIPGYGHMLGMMAFSHEEAGDYATAERLGRAAVELNADDLWGIHAVAHVLEMTGRISDGVRWIDYPDDAWNDRIPIKNHLWWHRALFFFDAGDYERVLHDYDHLYGAGDSTVYIDIQNAAAMLWRLHVAGIGVGERWEQLADRVETVVDQQLLAFTDPHITAVLGAAKRSAALDRQQQAISRRAHANSEIAVDVATVTVPLNDAIANYWRGAYSETNATLRGLRLILDRTGGSHAQRDVFDLAMLDAAIKAGDAPTADGLSSERIRLKPESRLSWQLRAQALQLSGDAAGAAAAQARGEDIGLTRFH